VVLPGRIELTTSPLPRGCSTTELRQHRAAYSPEKPINQGHFELSDFPGQLVFRAPPSRTAREHAVIVGTMTSQGCSGNVRRSVDVTGRGEIQVSGRLIPILRCVQTPALLTRVGNARQSTLARDGTKIPSQVDPRAA